MCFALSRKQKHLEVQLLVYQQFDFYEVRELKMKLQIKLIQPQFINKALGPCLAMALLAGQKRNLQLVSFWGVRYEGLYSKLSLPPNVLGFFRDLCRSFKQLRGSRLVNIAIAKSEGVMKGQAHFSLFSLCFLRGFKSENI